MIQSIGFRKIALITASFFFAMGCGVKAPSTQEDYLFAVNGTKVTAEEFAYVYRKNNAQSDSAFTQEDIKEYLDLFINFKLKVKEAEQLGLDTAQSFRQEYSSYLDQLAEPYLQESEVTEQLIKEAYDRLKEEVNVSHILIMAGANDAPADTLEAYNKAMEVWQEASDGSKPFDELAAKYSEEPNANKSKGNLGYFTAFAMVYPFENASFDTPVGSVSKPIRTQFGYHVVKVNDRRPSRGKVQVSHIMVRTQKGASPEDSTTNRNKIFEIHDMLAASAEWNDVCQRYSDDVNTKNRGGLLPEFGPGRMIKSFEDAAFSLDSVGQISDPFQTPFGWHVARLEKKTGLEDFAILEPELRKAIDRNPRSQLNRQKLIARLKRENSYTFNQQLLTEVVKKADSTLTKGIWSYDSASTDLRTELFQIKSEIYSLSDFYEYIAANPKLVSYSPQFYMQQLYDQYLEQELIETEKKNLEEKHIDYRMLKREYREGILLFQLMEEKVWNRASIDTVGLANFFSENQNKYQWKKRAEVAILTGPENVIKEIRANFNGDYARFFQNDSGYVAVKKELEAEYNAQSSLTLQIEKGLFEAGERPLVDAVQWEIGDFEVAKDESTNLIVINSILAPGPKELSDVRGLVISEYQKQLEKEWVEELRKKYTVDLNESELNHIYEILSQE